MAMTLKLVRTADFEAADIESLSLLSYTNGFSVERGGWMQAIAGEYEASVIETMTIYAKGTSHDDLSAKLVALDKLLAKSKWYVESPERYGLWLRAQLTGETNARQALVLGTRRGPAQVFSPPASPGNTIKGYSLSIERMPLWEATAVSALLSDDDVSSVGGYVSIGAIPGTAPARIASIEMYQNSLIEFWAGFRTARNGTLANFVSPWQLELGSEGTDTLPTTDATASPGGGGNTKMACTFATTTAFAPRVTITPYQISTTKYTHFRGTFEILLRAKCATGITTRVRLSSGLAGTSSYQYCGPVTVTGTSWKLYSLGRITLPVGGKTPTVVSPGTSNPFSAMMHSTIQIEAELTVGASVANALDMDCIIPIPVDEGYFHVKGSQGNFVALHINPLGHVAALETNGAGEPNGIADSSGISADLCVIPNDASDVRVVWAAQRAAGSTLGDLIGFFLYYIPRYNSLRGSG